MTQSIYITSTHRGSGLSSVTLGILKSCVERGLAVSYYQPIAERNQGAQTTDLWRSFVSQYSVSPLAPTLSFEEVEEFLLSHHLDDLLEKILQHYLSYQEKSDLVIIEGLNPERSALYVSRLNPHIATTLNSHVILVTAPLSFSKKEFLARLDLHAQMYQKNIAHHFSLFFNKMPSSAQDASAVMNFSSLQEASQVLKEQSRCLLGWSQWDKAMSAPRVVELKEALGAQVLIESGLNKKVSQVLLAGQSTEKFLTQLSAHSFVIIPDDRFDILTAAIMAVCNGIPLSGILLTNDNEYPKSFEPSLSHLQQEQVCLLKTHSSAQEALRLIEHRVDELATDCIEQLEFVSEYFSAKVNGDALDFMTQSAAKISLTPPAFRYSLRKMAQAASARIVLPEGEEPRTIRAAISAHEKKIAQCVLLGKKEKILHYMHTHGLECPDSLEIVCPETIKEHFVEPMLKLRAHKNLVEPVAREQLEDPVVVGMMMLATGQVDGLVAGVEHSTAHILRPALQLIGVNEDTPLMSSLFFMCLPKQVVVYADCAVNPCPSAEQLAHIALQTAQSAEIFGIEPKVAMLSYSTGDSGKGEQVLKVKEATQRAKEQRPDLIIDGPLQYDAAVNREIAKKKAPESKVAGEATVFIFPDLNTGNTTYKAVQRAADVVSIGPMLQGLKKPVNDLSRGAGIDDIVYTIALTAIQAKQPL